MLRLLVSNFLGISLAKGHQYVAFPINKFKILVTNNFAKIINLVLKFQRLLIKTYLLNNAYF